MKQLKVLWEFSRPHTIIGSFLSITSLYLVSVAIVHPDGSDQYIFNYKNIYLTTLISSLCCNIYITGLNQLLDIEIDKINKPWLPIPSGNLTPYTARIIIIFAGLVALGFAASANIILLALIVLIMGIGTAYSLPPLKFKRHHLTAAASILLVRGVLVNMGMPMQFIFSMNDRILIPPDVWPLTLFVTGFSLAIAWFKDIPDASGDKLFNIKTLALTLSVKSAFRYGIAVVAISYCGLLLFAAIGGTGANQLFFFPIHALLLLLFLGGAAKVTLDHPDKLKKFYMVFWGFFFAEYIVYAASYYV